MTANPGFAAGAPITVVVVSLIGGAALDACVHAVAAQAAEVVVVADPNNSFGDEARVRFIGGALEHVPAKRLRGLKAARFPIVAFIEDTCLPGPAWCSAVYGGFADNGVAAVCGPVEISRSLPPRHCALGIAEYARFQASALVKRSRAATRGDHPFPTELTGPNFAVRHSAMEGVGGAENMIDGALFRQLRSKGAIRVAAAAVVIYSEIDRRGARLCTRFHHGRIYGGMNAAGKSMLIRIVLTAKGLAAPAAQLARSCRDAPAWFWRSPRAIAWFLAMNFAWSAGEAFGAATGRVGSSLSRWA